MAVAIFPCAECGQERSQLYPGWNKCSLHRQIAQDLAAPDYKEAYYAETHQDGFTPPSWGDSQQAGGRGGFNRRFGLAGVKR